MRGMIILAAAAASMLGACTTPGAGDPMMAAGAGDPMSPLSAPGYMQMAASSDLFEIESSRLALMMSRNPAVRSFAQMMINDHSRTTNELMAAAGQMGMQPPPPQMLPHHVQMLDRLRNAPMAEFDRAYKAEQIMAHQEALTLHRNFADRGDARPLQFVASRAVPVVEMHYGHAQQLPEYTAVEPVYQPPMAAPRRAGERG